MAGLFLPVYMCFLAVSVAFPHAAYDIKTLKARDDGCQTKHVTITSMNYIQPNVAIITRTARMTLLVRITPFYNGSTSTSTETIGRNSTTTAMENPTITWGTFSIPLSKVMKTSNTITAAPGTTSVVPDTTTVIPEATPSVPETTSAVPVPDTTSAAWFTLPIAWNKTTTAWNTTMIANKRMVMPTADNPYRYWNSSAAFPTGYYPTNGPTGPTEPPVIPPGSRTCEVTFTSTSTSAQTLPAPSYIVTETAITVTTLFDYDHLTPPVYAPSATTTADAKDPAGIQNPIDPPHTTKDSLQRPGQINVPPQDGPIGPTATAKDVITQRPDSPTRPSDTVPLPIVTLPGADPIAIDPSRSVIIIGDKTSAFNPGQQTTVNNVPISFDTSAEYVVVGGTKTIGLPPMTPAPIAPTAIIGGTTVDIDQIATQLQPGQVTMIGSHTISRDDSGSFLLVDGMSTIALPHHASIPSTSTLIIDGVPISIGELARELAPGQRTIIGSIIITRDSFALIIGTSIIPIPATANEIVLGGTTLSVGALPSGFSFIPATAGGGLLLPNGKTLMPGGETTIDGIEISLKPGETPVAVVEDSISVTATVSTESTVGGDTCSGGGMCAQPSKTLTGQTGKTSASSTEELACGNWHDIVFAGFFVGVFMDWA